MKTHEVRTYKSAEDLPRENQLAWKIAEVAADPVAVDADVTDMIINRVIDNAAVAAALASPAPITPEGGVRKPWRVFEAVITPGRVSSDER